MNPNKVILFALVCAVVAVPTFAASYVVPPDDVFIGKSDAVVIARAVTTYSRPTATGDIETVTTFSLTETEKGFVGPSFEVRIPGGVLADRVKLVPGAPSFEPGTDYLLFLRHLPDGGFASTDFGLGVFAFGDSFGRRTVRRSAEIYGWDVDGSTHLEFQRDAGAFIRYIRSVAAGASPAPDYVTGVPASGGGSMRPAAPMVTSLSTFTGTSYTISCGGGGEGCTWTGFPVTFNQGNTEPGAPGPVGQEGKSAITSACAAWSGTGVGINYSLATFNANSNGILDATDHVNNVVFEKNLTSAGASAYLCASGGVLGIGGINSASGTHLHNGETYINTTEVDVSMNQGIANCTSLFTSGDFTTGVTHEIGHTLGFRHSDQTRADNPSIACSTDPSLDCSSNAVMRSSIPHNLSGALQTYDISAAQTVYGTGPACTPAAIGTQPAGSTITQGSQATLSVTATGTSPFSYQWYVGTSGDTSSPVGGGTTASIQVSPSSTTSYWVKVTNSCNATGANSNTATVTVNVVSCTPPQITTQPTGSSITFGSSAQLSVVASGTGPLTYQWYSGAKGNTTSPVFNGTTSTISVNPQSTTTFWVRVTGACAPTADSNAVTVTVSCLAPQVSVTPGSRTITQGSSTIFSAIASGGPNMTFQWYQGIAPDTSNPVSGQTGSSITVSPTASTSYWVQVSVSGCGTANSNTVSVTVNPNNGCAPVTVATPTATQNGASYTLSTTASSTAGGVTITWYQQTSTGQVAIGTGTSISVSPTVTTTYLAQAQNSCGSTNSATVTVTIGAPPCTAPNVVQPPNETIGLGSSTTITVTATGSGTLHYQWYHGAAGDTSVPVGTDSATLTTGPLTTNSSFWVNVTNDCNSSTPSVTITITVEPARHRSVHH